MFIQDLKSLTQAYYLKQYSGHVRVGVEQGSITSIIESSNIRESKPEIVDLDNICDDEYNFYGNIELDFIDGAVSKIDWTRTYKGRQIQEKLKGCKSV